MYVAFDQMWRELRWKRIKGFNSKVGSPGTDFSKFVIATTPEGINGYLALNRNSNDRLRKANDAGYGDDPTFNSIDLEDFDRLEETTTAGVPPFYWLNLEMLFPVYHSDTFMEEVGPIRGSINQPFSWAVYKNTYMNLFCRSRRRQGLIQTTA